VFDSSSTTCKTLRVMNDSHTPGTTVLHVKVSIKTTFPNYVLIVLTNLKSFSINHFI